MGLELIRPATYQKIKFVPPPTQMYGNRRIKIIIFGFWILFCYRHEAAPVAQAKAGKTNITFQQVIWLGLNSRLGASTRRRNQRYNARKRGDVRLQGRRFVLESASNIRVNHEIEKPLGILRS